ncbi:MAG: AAA family ATPase [Coriobacteriales bacterium]|nr:AAA family ATPase [Coriobacteriales bacterium]
MPQQYSIYKPRFGTGFYGGKFLPFHQGHLNCIFRAAAQCEKLNVVLMHHGPEELEFFAWEQEDAPSGDKAPCFPKRYLTPEYRELALRHELQPFENIEVISYDCREADERAQREGKHPWYYECEDMVNLMGHFDAAFSSEEAYSRAFREFYPWSEAVLLDPERKDVPISGTDLRAMPLSRAYVHLPRSYQVLLNKSVLITGTESCGKSNLVRKLAAFFATTFTEEYGKLVCEEYNVNSPGIGLYNGFLFGQKSLEQKACEHANRVYFCDTDALVTAYYARMFEKSELPLAYAIAQESHYDMVLYVEPTVPWVDDGYRCFGSPEQRSQGDSLLKSLYDKAGIVYHVLNGTYEENYRQAIKLTESLLDA